MSVSLLKLSKTMFEMLPKTLLYLILLILITGTNYQSILFKVSKITLEPRLMSSKCSDIFGVLE